MSTAGERDAVFRSTKVRTKLKGDASWMQLRNEPQAETQEEKPWVAEVRASRLNGAPVETSPVSSPTRATPPPTKTDTDRAPTSGYLIRGVFTKLDKPASSSTYNGLSKTTQFTNKPSESYKRIAPHTVRPTSEHQEGQLSLEEQEKRTEAASTVLRKSAARQRSYVLSAAQKYESKEKAPDTSLVSSTPSFVAKRVEITDDDENAVPPSPAVPVTSVASVPEPKPRKLVSSGAKTAVDVAVNEPVAPKVEEATPEPVKKDPLPLSVTGKDPFEDMKPGCTKVATPLPELIAECIQAASSKPEPEEADTPLAERSPPVSPTPTHTAPKVEETPAAESPAAESLAPETPASETPAAESPASETPAAESPAPETPAAESPASETPAAESPAPETPASETPAPESPAPQSVAPPSTVPEVPGPVSPLPPSPASKAEPEPEPVQEPEPEPEQEPEPEPEPEPVQEPEPEPEQEPEPEPEPEPEQEPEPEPEPEPVQEPEPEPKIEVSPKPSSGVDTLTALSDTLISFGPSSSSFQDDEPELAKKEGGSADSYTTENSVEQKPALSNCEPITDDLLGLNDRSEESAEPVPSSPGRWSQDLLSGLDSESSPEKTSGTLDLLANDVIVINSEAPSLSMQREEEEKQTDETAKETQSPTETVTITTKTVIITDKSQEDNADPWSSHVTTTVTESSSADPFDPYPIGTTSPNSSSDLLQPRSDISINSASAASMEKENLSPETNVSSSTLEPLADDVIPTNTDTTSTRRLWTRTWESSTPQQTNTGESQEAEPEAEGQAEAPQTLVMFERKSTENDSPWDRWTSPTVYTITSTTTEEEEEEEESPEDTQTVTTITTIREMHGEPESAMDRSETFSRTVIEDEQRVQTPEPDAKRGFVYVKEYMNATELSLHNPRDIIDRGSDYLTSSSVGYSYSSPSTYSRAPLSSTCTYCGEQVGNDAKITIEHLNINCHPACFKCDVCSKPMGDLLYSMFIHSGKVYCESCYSTVN